MAKGTSYGDVNYSVPEGADPLGIGVLDLGKSSYDPIDTIRRFNETRRQNQHIKTERKREDYRNFQESLPTVSGVNQKIAASMNKDILEMSRIFKEQQSLGVFAGLGKTPEGEKSSAKLSKLENKVGADAPVYQHYSDQYEKDQAILRNPTHKDKIDLELTRDNIDEMEAANNVEEFASAFSKNGGSVIVYKPTPADLAGFVQESIKVWAPGEDTEVLSNAFDPNTLKWKTETLTTKDQDRLARAIMLGYDNAEPDDPNKREIDRKYEEAPDSEKVDDNGIKMDAGMWYANKNVPGWGSKKNVSYTNIAKGADQDPATDWSKMFGGVSFNNGALVLGAPSIKPVTRQLTKQVQVSGGTKRHPEGTKNKPAVFEDKEYSEDEEYYAYTAELSGVIDKPFAMETSTDTRNQRTGEKIDAGMVLFEQPTNVSMMPKAKEKVVIQMPDGETVTIPKGEAINKGRFDQMTVDKQLDQVEWDWFVTSASSVKKTPEGKDAAGDFAKYGDEYIPTHQVTTIRPWADAKNAVIAEASAKFDLTQMANIMENMKRQKNHGVQSIINSIKDMTDEEVFDEFF